MADKIVLFYDCVSPWSYVAFHMLCAYREKWDVQVEWRPATLGYVMKFSDNKPPVTVPNKGAHMMRLLGSVPSTHGCTNESLT